MTSSGMSARSASCAASMVSRSASASRPSYSAIAGLVEEPNRARGGPAHLVDDAAVRVESRLDLGAVAQHRGDPRAVAVHLAQRRTRRRSRRRRPRPRRGGLEVDVPRLRAVDHRPAAPEHVAERRRGRASRAPSRAPRARAPCAGRARRPTGARSRATTSRLRAQRRRLGRERGERLLEQRDELVVDRAGARRAGARAHEDERGARQPVGVADRRGPRCAASKTAAIAGARRRRAGARRRVRAAGRSARRSGASSTSSSEPSARSKCAAAASNASSAIARSPARRA